MKVYVDKLPKSCNDCPCFYDESISCQASDKWLPLDEEDNFSRSTQRHPTCPLQSLADYTKQVRKEVCNGINAELYSKMVLHNEKLEYSEIALILKRIQGETK